LPNNSLILVPFSELIQL